MIEKPGSGMIEVRDFSAAYDDKIVFEHLNFSLDQGSFTALCGRNGSGKSTLLSLMAGLVPAGLTYSGDILIDGKNLFEMKRNEAAKRVSFLMQSENPVWNLSVRQFVETGLYSYGQMTSAEIDFAVEEALSKIGIEAFADKHVFNISGGEFQKCRLARCLVQKSPLMLFDEPGDKLDMPFQQNFLKTIKALGKTVLFSIHEINVASLFTDDFLLLSQGQLLRGNRKEIFNKELLDKAFAAETEIYLHPVRQVPQVLFL